MNNYVSPGKTITVIAPYAVLGGGGVEVIGTGYVFGVAVCTQAIGDNMEIVTEGVFDLAKDGSVFVNGDYVYWDNTAKLASSVNTNKKIGTAVMMQPSGANAPGSLTGDPTVRVRLNPSF